MKKNFLSLLLVAFCSCLMSTAQVVLLPLGQSSQEPWDAKYFFATNSSGQLPVTGWYQSDFDESAWDSIQGPISLGEGGLLYSATKWKQFYSTYWLRRHFHVSNPNDYRALDMHILHDDRVEVYLNGSKLYENHKYGFDSVAVSENVPGLLRAGDNVVAVKVMDDGGINAFIDFGVRAYKEPFGYSELQAVVENLKSMLAGDLSKSNPAAVEDARIFIKETTENMANFTYSSNEAYFQRSKGDWIITRLNYKFMALEVKYPGSMGDSILAKVENFSDVKSLKVSGMLNAADLETLSKRLTNLRELDIRDVKLLRIENYQFQSHPCLEKIYLPTCLNSIGEKSFRLCQSLKEVVFSEELKSIEEYAFEQCDLLYKVTLPEGLVNLGIGAFNYCVGNSYVKIPSTVKEISEYAFKNNHHLKKIDFAEGLITIGREAFHNCAIEKLVLPSTVREIDGRAFSQCKKMKSVKFNEGLYQIRYDAFEFCEGLTEVVLPSSLVLSDGSPFSYCENLRKVTCLSIEPPYIPDQILYGCTMDGRELYVPALTTNIYKQSKGWDKFPVIKPIDYLPRNISVIGDLHLTLPENIPADYKPNVDLIHEKLSYDNDFHYGHLRVNGEGTLSINRFGMVWDPNYFYDNNNRVRTYCSLINNSHLRADSVEVKFYVHNDVWTFLSFPFDVKVSEIQTTSAGYTNWIIRRYDGARRAKGESGSTWQKMGPDEILKAGEGYIMQSSRYVDNSREYYSGFMVKAVNNEKKNLIFTTKDVVRPLAEYASEFAHNRSWNLIGNPYPSYYDTRFMQFDAPITVWNSNNKTYTAYSTTDDAFVLCPGEAFFVQCPVDDNKVIFGLDGRQETREARVIDSAMVQVKSAPAALRTVVNLSISNEKHTDRTRIVLNENASLQYEMDKDASKFLSPDLSVPQISSVAEDITYAINERPLKEGFVELSTRVGVDGFYTIILNNPVTNYKVILEDKLLDKSVVLSENDAYSFSAKSTDTDRRFTLRFVQEVTGIDNVDSSSNGKSSIYTLGGVKVDVPSVKGVYVKDGKKVLFNK